MVDTKQPFLGAILKGAAGKVATAVVTAAVQKAAGAPEVPIPAQTNAAVVDALAAGIEAKTITIVPVKSGWFSKINWTAALGPVASGIAAFLAGFGLDLTSEQIIGVVIGVQTLQSILTWVFRTFFNKTANA